MLFACDLDRTLIYSSSFLVDKAIDVNVVEYKDSLPLSYMSKASIELLEAVSRECDFIPVTARTIKQYDRISIFKDRIVPTYAVAANGGIVLKNGNEDLGWKDIVESKLNRMLRPSELSVVCDFFLKDNELECFRFCGEIYFYTVFKSSDTPVISFEKLVDVCTKNGYRVYKDKRKLYIIPNFINKYDPITYIMNQKNETDYMAAGDSILDIPMLKSATFAYIPLHGQLAKEDLSSIDFNSPPTITQSTGFKATEEILNSVLCKFR